MASFTVSPQESKYNTCTHSNIGTRMRMRFSETAVFMIKELTTFTTTANKREFVIYHSFLRSITL